MDPKQRAIKLDMDMLFTGVSMRAYTKEIDGKQVKFIGGTASSTAIDLYGDIITAAGQVKMLEKLRALADRASDKNSGLTAWLNHSYKIPEDTLGAFVSASLTTRTGDGINDEQGVEYIDLDIECRVTETNARALAAWEQVKDGIQHGWSIGAIFLAARYASDDPDSPDYWTLLIDDLNLLEISLVGLPANQRAWAKSAEDLKARAVSMAEKIISDAQKSAAAGTVPAGREAPDVVVRRSMVLKSIVHMDEPEVRDAEPTPAAATEPTETVEPPQENAVNLTRADAIAKLKELHASLTGDKADDVAQKALDAAVAALEAPGVTPEDATVLSTDLRALEVEEPMKATLGAAADAIDVLAKLAANDGDSDPSNVTKAIGFLAKAIGHGLCMRSAQYISKAVDCMSAAVGTDAPAPEGDPDETLSAIKGEITKLEPKEGDVFVIRTTFTPEQLDAFRTQWAAELKDVPAKVVFLSAGVEAATIDNDLAAKATELLSATEALDAAKAEVATKAAELADATTAIEAKNAEIATLDATIATSTEALKDLSDKIAAASDTRLGRKGLNEQLDDLTRRDTAVKPEDYQANATVQAENLAKSLSGDSKPSGRDTVVAP